MKWGNGWYLRFYIHNIKFQDLAFRSKMLLAGRCSQWQSMRFQGLEPSPDRTHVHSVMDWSTQMLQRHVSSSFLRATWRRQASKFIDQKRIPYWKKNQTEKENVLSDWTWATRIIWHAPWQGKWVRTHHSAKATIEPFWADSWEAPPWIKCTPCPPRPKNSVNWGSTGCKTNKNPRNRPESRPGALDKLCRQHPRRSIMIRYELKHIFWSHTVSADHHCLWAASIHESRFVSEFPMIPPISLVACFSRLPMVASSHDLQRWTQGTCSSHLINKC